jgi:Rad3-related DNA helicase/serine/threonine protein kinase
LGEGSTVHTYLYRHEQRKKYAVIKFTRAPLITLEEKEAFLNRTKLLKKLKHRYIAEVVEASFHSMGEPADDYGYVILQYIEGNTIDERFKAGQCYAPDEVRRVLLSLADTLQYAHKMFATHGNLHPGNVLQTERDFFLTDFSLPVPAGEQEGRALLYRAPEQLHDKDAAPTPASDQYALAVMAYEWLCGRRPYLATDPRELLSQQMGGPIPAPSSFNEQISPLVEKVLLQALTVNPRERFPQTLAFADTYLRALMGLPPASQASISLASAPAPQPQPQPSSSSTPASDVKVAQAAPSRKKKSAARQAAASLEVPTATETPAALKLVATEHPSAPAQAVGATAPVLATQVQPEAAVTPVRERSSQATFALVRERVQSEPKAPPDRSSYLSEPGDLQRRVEADLRQGGVLSRALPGYEERPAQIEMAALVARSISDNTPAIIEASTGTGKALDVNTPIPTPTGWKRMGDLKMGDLVFDEQGQPTCVTAAFDVMYNRPCYEVAFSDGSSLIADAEHEWASYTALDRMRLQDAHSETCEACSVPARRDISPQSSDSAREGRRAASSTQVVTLMAVAGDQAERSAQIAFGSSFERDFTGEVESASANQEYTLVTTEQMAATLTVASSQGPNHAIALAGALELPEVDLPIAPYTLGTWLGEGRFYRKHIPSLYLRSSARQRRALLAGLLDASGEIKRAGAIEFTAASLQLVEDVYELLCSLGFWATLHPRTGHSGEEGSPSAWTLAFTPNQPVFHLAQKARAQKEFVENVRDEHDCFRYVVAVRPVPTRPVRCIQVAAPSHLYLAGRAMIPTHNSLAYLISVVRSGKIAIVSTANKALQEQLFFKDIPFIQKYIRHIDAALVKGMGNYICLDRVEQERVGFQHYVRNRDFMRLLERIEESDERFTGDFETLGFTLPGDIRSKVSADRDQCTWSKCSYFADCYVHKMKSHAGQASVIVVNHTLLLLDAFMEGKLLPERDVIIVDEAHHLEEEATRAFTTTISQGQVATLLAQTMLKTHTPPALQEETKATMNLAWERLAQIADPGAKGRANLKEPLQEGLGLASMIDKLADALRTGRPKDLDEKDEQLYDKLLTRAQNLAADIRLVFSVNQPEKYVYYIERVQTGGRRGILQLEVSAAPLEVTNWLKEQLFEKSNVICTSATLATIGPDPARPEIKGPNFAYFRRRSGLDHESYPDVRERILPLTFDYEGHALLYLPRHIPEPVYGDGPAAQAYTRAIGREMLKLVEASRGRAFLLFSSKRMLDAVYEQFQAELPVHLKFPLLRQGDMTRIELVRSFREREGAVLFGLKSFWEGVDIAGEALSLVVIDKLPFDPPDDPVHEARVAQMKAAGENWFGTFVLPQTVLRLKQGLGRLLRTHDDRGVMAILDTRLYTRSYGKQIIQALPPARRAFNIETVIRFFQQPEDEDEAPF